MNAPNQSNFSWEVRVYYEDTDAAGIVFYANYLKFFERARTEWLRSGDITQSHLVKSDNIIFVVKSTAIEYHAPARLDDRLQLTLAVERIRRTALDLFQQAWRIQNGVPILLATGRITVVCVHAAAFKPQAIPLHIVDQIKPTSITV